MREFLWRVIRRERLEKVRRRRQQTKRIIPDAPRVGNAAPSAERQDQPRLVVVPPGTHGLKAGHSVVSVDGYGRPVRLLAERKRQ